MDKDVKPVIHFEPVFHRNAYRILIRYAAIKTINDITRQLPNAQWSRTHKAWHIPMNEGACKLAIEKLNPSARIDLAALRSFLQQQKAVQQPQLKNNPVIVEQNPAIYHPISKENPRCTATACVIIKR